MILWNIFHQTSLWDTYSRYLYTRARFQKRSDQKVIGSLISRQLTISRSGSDSTNAPAPIRSWSSAILLATWIGVGSETSTQQLVILSVIFTLVEIHKLPGNIYWNMACLVSTVCILSVTLITYTYTYLLIMACPNRVVYREQTLCACTELTMTLSYRYS